MVQRKKKARPRIPSPYTFFCLYNCVQVVSFPSILQQLYVHYWNVILIFEGTHYHFILQRVETFFFHIISNWKLSHFHWQHCCCCVPLSCCCRLWCFTAILYAVRLYFEWLYFLPNLSLFVWCHRVVIALTLGLFQKIGLLLRGMPTHSCEGDDAAYFVSVSKLP